MISDHEHAPFSEKKMAQEESSRKEAEAYFSAYVRGRGGRGSGLGGAGVRGVRRGVGGI